MPDTDPSAPSWEPPLAGSEVQHLLASMDRMRATFRWKAGGLGADGLTRRLPPSTLTLGGLLKHLAAVEDHKSTVVLDGSPVPDVWAGHGWGDDPDWEFTSAREDSPDRLYALYDGAVARARTRFAAAAAAGGLGRPTALHDDDGNHPSLRRLLHDLVEEYSRHTGHADLLREAVDGRVGEDPPWDWEPPWAGRV